MSFRFRRSVRILPGIRINLSKTGGSLSIGGRGATVNVSSRGTRTTVGLPGTGLSWSSRTRPWGAGGAPAGSVSPPEASTTLPPLPDAPASSLEAQRESWITGARVVWILIGLVVLGLYVVGRAWG